MRAALTWLFRIAVGLLVLAVLAVGLVYLLLSRSLPDYDKRLQVDGITAPVEIVRDHSAVPHVFGRTDLDSFFGLGYVHAQDRLWQMEIMRRTVQGRLSEVFGPRTLEIDKLMRRFGFYAQARDSVDVQDARTRAALRAYAAGVNARIAEINERALGRGAPELFVFDVAIAPWQPADSIALLKLMAAQLSGHLQDEVLYARTSLMLDDPARLADIMPLAPGEGVAALPEYAALFPELAPGAAGRQTRRADRGGRGGAGAGMGPGTDAGTGTRTGAGTGTGTDSGTRTGAGTGTGTETGTDAGAETDTRTGSGAFARAATRGPEREAAREAARDPLWPFARPALAGASNAWAAAPSRAAAGGALLANDPHLALSAPSIWYLARIELPDGGVIGGTIPGIPLIIAGRSARLGWGVTSSYLDDLDLYIERLDPKDPTRYLTPEGYKPFRTENTIIRIRGAEPVTLTLRWSENGPVLPGTHFDLETVTPPGHVVSVAWTALSGHDTTMSAAMALMRARSIDEALAAGRFFVAPSQNLILTDGASIAMKTIGAMPLRDADHETEGRMPSRGWIAANRWVAMMPYADNPEFRDPPGGILGNTNNKMVERPFPRHVSYHWGDTQRVQRWRRLMQMRKVHTRDSFIEAQLDTVSFTARALLPLIGKDLWFTGEAAPAGTPERRRQRALMLLAAWNGEMNEHLPEPLIYAAWMRALMQRLIQDELGPLAAEFPRPDPVFLERVFRDIGGASAWCDIRQSREIETCTDIARMALDDALVWIAEHHGGALESLRWGDAHQAAQDHPALGKVPLLRYFVNIRQSTSGGDNTLNRGRTSGREPTPFLNVHAAGYRGVYDFADPDSSVFIISTGQSGHFLSRHYDDLSELWRRGEYIPMSLDPALARAAAVGVTVLEPRPR
ncbi:MAG: hypothetical protein Kow0058_15910 [Roseovarius sp.]